MTIAGLVLLLRRNEHVHRPNCLLIEPTCIPQAESAKHGVRSRVMSCNELGFDNLSADATPVVVIVASSTGDGDPPDNAAKFYVDLRSDAND